MSQFGRRRSPTRFATAVAVAACLALAAVAAQQPPPTFKSGIEVVLIDVNVVDRQGRPVASLRPEDFVVTVDRKPRKIVSAQFVGYEVGTRADRGVSPAVGAAVSDKPATPPPAAPPRTVLVVFDEDNLGTGDGIVARKAASAFLDRLGPADRIGVAAIPRPRRSITLTTDRAEVQKVLASVFTGGAPEDNTTKYSIGLAEALAFEQGDGDAMERIKARECYRDPAWQSKSVSQPAGGKGPEPLCLLELPLVVRQMQQQARLRGQRAIDALYDLGAGLGQVPGPKTMVLISGGMPMPDARSAASLSRLGEVFAAAQVSLYTIYVARNPYGQAKFRQSPTPAEDMSLERAGAENATGAVGGTMMESVGTPDQYFDRIVTELSGSYLLGIEVVAADSDNKPHGVQVRVNRPGVDVRARREYVIGDAASRNTAPRVGPVDFRIPIGPDTPVRDVEVSLGPYDFTRMRDAARTLEGVGDVIVQFTATRGTARGDVVIAATIDASTVSFTTIGGRKVARLGISVFCGDARRAVIGELWQEMSLELSEETYERFRRGGIPYAVHVTAKGVPRHVKMVVYDRPTDRVGAWTATVKARPPAS